MFDFRLICPDFRLMVVGLSLLTTPAVYAQTERPLMDSCPPSVTEQMKTHRVKAGETLKSIAQQYQLVPATLVNINASLRSGGVRPGQMLKIPPFNGQYVTAPNGATWQDLANVYGVRADILFEVNGCQAQPGLAFIPGVSWQANQPQKVDNYTGLSQNPIAKGAQIGLDYGWHDAGNSEEDAFFHSGIDILAPINTPVKAAAAGKVILVSQEGPYGFLVVIDHGNNRQTRYAHLGRFAVEPESQVSAGSIVGYVGNTGRPDIVPPHVHFEVRFKSPVGWAAQDPKLHLSR